MIAACQNIDQWPAPIPGETINLPLLGSVLQVCCVNVLSNVLSSSSSMSNVEQTVQLRDNVLLTFNPYWPSTVQILTFSVSVFESFYIVCYLVTLHWCPVFTDFHRIDVIHDTTLYCQHLTVLIYVTYIARLVISFVIIVSTSVSVVSTCAVQALCNCLWLRYVSKL